MIKTTQIKKIRSVEIKCNQESWVDYNILEKVGP